MAGLKFSQHKFKADPDMDGYTFISTEELLNKTVTIDKYKFDVDKDGNTVLKLALTTNDGNKVFIFRKSGAILNVIKNIVDAGHGDEIKGSRCAIVQEKMPNGYTTFALADVDE